MLTRRTAQFIDKAAQVVAAGVTLQFENRLRFDLADSLSRDLEDSSRFLEGVAIPVSQTETEPDDLALAVGQRIEDDVDLVLEDSVQRRFGRRVLRSIGEQVSQ